MMTSKKLDVSPCRNDEILVQGVEADSHVYLDRQFYLALVGSLGDMRDVFLQNSESVATPDGEKYLFTFAFDKMRTRIASAQALLVKLNGELNKST